MNGQLFLHDVTEVVVGEAQDGKSYLVQDIVIKSSTGKLTITMFLPTESPTDAEAEEQLP